MNKNQFRKLAHQLGYISSYSGSSKTFYLTLVNNYPQEDLMDFNSGIMELQSSGFGVKYNS